MTNVSRTKFIIKYKRTYNFKKQFQQSYNILHVSIDDVAVKMEVSKDTHSNPIALKHVGYVAELLKSSDSIVVNNYSSLDII